MAFSQSNIPAADYLVNRDPWLRRFGGREAGKRISEQLYECCPPILRGRPIYDRLPGAAQAYNKDQDTFISKGTIILPEAKTVISTAEDLYFRTKFPSEYEERDYITGSFLGPGSAAALYENTNQAVKVGDDINNVNILLRSAIFFWGEDRVRDETEIAKKTIDFPGAVIQFTPVTSGWIWIDGEGNLNITQGLPDGVANLSGNIWCDQNADPALGQTACVERVNIFERETGLRDVLDVGDTSETVTWPPTEECEFSRFNEVAPLFYFVVNENGIITQWDDYRIFNTTFDPPIARYLMDYWDNLLQDKREQIDVFIDDSLIPDTAGRQYILCDSILRTLYREEIVDKILDSWDFGIITLETRETIFNFLGQAEILELSQYDTLTHAWLDWLAQHFGLQDNDNINANYWHKGSQFDNVLQENEVFYTIAEKRAILRNALGQDPFQELRDKGEFVEGFPIWNLVTDFWDLTELFWNSTDLVPAGTTEFVFTRFPFTTYNRIKPANWQGLLKEKGTTKSLEFMFDVLGLHGYACTTSDPRFQLTQADFRTPLIPFKFTNSVLVENRKQLNADGSITDIIPLEPRIGNYEETGYVRTGETILMQGYDRKLVVRAPFGWARNSQQFNRMLEISRTYVKEGDLVTGYYNFLTGNSAAGEPVWKREECSACKYVGTTWHTLSEDKSILTDWYNNTDEFVNGEYTWIQNLRDTSLWNGIGFDRDPNFRVQDAIYPIYVDNRKILAINYDGIGAYYSQDNTGQAFPVIVSNDNGYSFEPLTTDLPSTLAITYRNPRKLRHTGLSTFLVDERGILKSDDDGNTWNEVINYYSAEIDSKKFHDIFRDEDRRRTYIASGRAIYGKIDGEAAYSKLYELPLEQNGGGYYEYDDAVLRSNGTEIVGFFTDSGDSFQRRRLAIWSSPDFGVTNFVPLKTGNLFSFADAYQYKIRAVNNSLATAINDTAYAFLYSPTLYASDGASKLYSKTVGGDVIEQSQFITDLTALAAENRPSYFRQVSGLRVTDIKQNLRNNRFEYFVTTLITNRINIASPGDPVNYSYETEPIGEIYSSNLTFEDLQREQSNFKLVIEDNDVDIQTNTGDFIIKQQQLQDINAAPVDEEITYNAYNTEQICSECGPGGSPQFADIPVTEYTLYIPIIDELHPSYPTVFHTNENNDVYVKSVAIHAQDYITGFKHVHWETPKNSEVLRFNVANNDIASETGRQFTPLEIPPVGQRFDPTYPGRYETLEVYSLFAPSVEFDPGYWKVKREFEPIFVNLVGHSETDTKTVTFKLIPIYGHYYNNLIALPDNTIVITFDDLYPKDFPGYPGQVTVLDASEVEDVQVNIRELAHPIVRNEVSWSFSLIGTTSLTITVDPPFDTDSQYELSWQADLDFRKLTGEVIYQTSVKIHHEAP